MKKILFLLGLVAVVAGRAFSGLTADQLGHFPQQLSDPNPTVRASALTEFLRTAKPETAGNDVLPILSKALADTDETVRARAAANLAWISLATNQKLKQLPDNATDLRSYPPLQKALIAAFNDADEETRKNALAAYVLTFDVPPAMQDALVNRYELERPFSLFRTATLMALTIDGAPTPAAKLLLIKDASDPKTSAGLARIIQDSKAAPVELLPYFVTQFNSARDRSARYQFALTISKFGGAAKPYIPVLERAGEVESDSIAKQAITSAVASISAAK